MNRSKYIILLVLLFVSASLGGCQSSPSSKQASELGVGTTGSALEAKGSSSENSGNTLDTSGNEQEVANDNSLVINLSNRVHPISPTLYGAFFEDINYGADGGLYGELTYNRSFEIGDGLKGWTVGKEGKGTVTIQTNGSLNENNPHYIEVKMEDSGLTLTNKGLSGMLVKKGETYHFTGYMKVLSGEWTGLKISLVDEKGNMIGEGIIGKDILEKQLQTKAEPVWTKQSVDIEVMGAATEEALKTSLVISPIGTGAIQMDMLSLFPESTFNNRENGLRMDLATAVKEMTPKFFRFPGGCVVEGMNMDNAYRWKDTIGPVEMRKENSNLWGYQQSYGLGFYEYFLFCEDIGAEPLPVINVGMACQARKGDLVAIPDLQPYIQDALDLVEYANGDASTTWGAIRIASGHPEPFHMKYLAVGNEQWGQAYYDRYFRFYKALHEKYPEIQLVFAAGPLAEGGIFEDAWKFVKNGQADLVDEHYYMAPNWFYANVDRYDDYDRTGPKVFVGEYAAHGTGKRNNMESALAEAAFMTGLEKNSDVVAMASYAPLFGKIDASQWNPDLIWFNNSQTLLTPNYYVQKLFANNKGDYLLESQLTTGETAADVIPIKGSVGVGSWSTSVAYKDIQVTSATGEVLLSADNTSDLSKWIKNNGDWQTKDGVIQQTKLVDNCFMYTGPKDLQNYTITLKAKKNGGNEGFLIMFGAKDKKNYYWWNLGGWGNTQSAIEKSVAGSKSMVGSGVPYEVKTGEWINLKVEVSGDQIKCYANEVLVHEERDQMGHKALYATVSETESHEVIVKMVNASTKDQNVHVTLNGLGTMEFGLKGFELIGESAITENTLKNPEAIKPEEVAEKQVNQGFDYLFPANSVSVLRLKTVE